MTGHGIRSVNRSPMLAGGAQRESFAKRSAPVRSLFVPGPSRAFLFAVLTFEVAISLFVWTIASLQENESRHLEAQADAAGTIVSRTVASAVNELYVATSELEMRLRTNGFETGAFPQWWEEIRAQNGGVDVLQLAPDGIIRSVLPAKGFESAIGANLFASAYRRQGALEARRTGKTNFIGPVRVRQNGRMAIIARRPVFRERDQGDFWGFAIAIIYLDTLVEPELRPLEGKYFYSLTGHDPDSAEGAQITNARGVVLRNGIAKDISAPNGTWRVVIEPRPMANLTLRVLQVLALPISLFLAVFVYSRESSIRDYQLRLIQHNQQLATMADTDSVTGLLNRRAFIASVEKVLASTDLSSSPVAVIFSDIDRFKQINDTHGHAAGDDVLRAFAQCLRTAIGDAGFIARFGGDEFVALILGRERARVREIAEEICRTAAHTPLTLGDRQIAYTISSGIGYADATCTGIDDLMRRADQALYDAKDGGRNQVREHA